MFVKAFSLYCQMAPLERVYEALQLDTCNNHSLQLNESTQSKIAKVFFENCHIEKYPPQSSYIHRFLKKLIKEAEVQGQEVSETLLTEFIDTITPSQHGLVMGEEDEYFHLSFKVPNSMNDQLIICRVSGTFSQVGLKVWEAGLFLSEYIISNPNVFQNKRVIELGSGVGLTGLVLSKCTSSQSIMLTDYAPLVMQNLRYNLEINSEIHGFTSSDLKSSVLDWEDWTSSDSKDFAPDIILAGDCVYDKSVFSSLLTLVKDFLTSKNGSYALFASTIRNKDTFESFLQHISKEGLKSQDITQGALIEMGDPVFYYENRDSIRLCKLSLI